MQFPWPDATRGPKQPLHKTDTRKPIPAREVIFGALVFPLLVIGVFSSVDVWWRSTKLVAFPWNILGVPVLSGGLALGAWCLQTLRRTPPGVTLVTWGPWGRSRHPIYLAGQLVNLGVSVLIGTLALFAGFAIHVVIDRLGARLEERGLRRRLGSRYAAYAESVTRWLPRFPRPAQRVGDPPEFGRARVR